MSEQSTLAKLRRRAISIALRSFGPAVVLRYWPISAPECAALASHRCRDIGTAPTVVFAIPIVGKHQVDDWQVIERTLARTLATLLDQDCDNVRVMVCGQDRPEQLRDDPRIHFVHFADRPKTHDKVPKLIALAAALSEIDVARGLYMPFDGDDLLENGSISAMQTGGTGFLVENGYIQNAATGEIAQTTRRSLSQPAQKPFWKFCGSCAAFPFVLDDTGKDIAMLQGLAQHEHRLYPYLASLAGMTLKAGAIPSVLYLINHGENFETRRGRGGFKQRFVERFKVYAPETILARFTPEP
jgi:hypothetical protein